MSKILCLLAALAFAAPASAQQLSGPSSLTVGTTAISGGSAGQCLTIGSGVLGSGACGATYSAGAGLTLTAGSFSLGDSNLTYSSGAQWLSASVALGNTNASPFATLYGDASGVLALRNNATAQALRVYNNWSSNGANFERGVFDWIVTANTLTIGTQAGGTGVNRGIDLAPATGLARLNAGSASAEFQVLTTANTNSTLTIRANGGTVGYFGRISSVFGIFDGSASQLLVFSGAGTSAVATFSGVTKGAVFTVATLPAGATAGAGARSYVSDAVSCSFGSAPTGGGSTGCAVFWNGSSWVGG
jgi:hypothetical protein